MIALLIASGGLTPIAGADQNYSQQVLFENSLSPDSYFYSSGKSSAPSSIALIDGKLPVETRTFVSGPNALRLAWQSSPQGGWEAELYVYAWRNRYIDFPGKYLFVWMYADGGLPAKDLPRLALRDADHHYFTRPLDIASFVSDLPARRWTRVRIPMSAFQSGSLHAFEPRGTSTLVFTQGEADGAQRTLLVDDIRIADDDSDAPAPPRVEQVGVKGYERHVDITWGPVNDPHLAQYVIYRSLEGGAFKPIGVQRPGVNRYSDYLGEAVITASYKVSARTMSLRESPLSDVAIASTHPMSDDELLTMVEEASFHYYWEAAEPNSGMTRENTPGDDDVVATGATGFGIMALMVGAERDFITRQQAVKRLLRITSYLATADRYHGVWPHFLSGSRGHTLPVFGMFDDGADLVETSFLMEGLLSARQYFNGSTPDENELHTRITQLWEGVDWDFFRGMPTRDALYWHWSPDYGSYIQNRLTGWNEVMITYLLAIASPTHGVSASLYYTGWIGESIHNKYVNGGTYYGIPLAVGTGTGGPLFFTDYSYMGFDPRSIHDKYTDYFEQNRNMARINLAYCEHNPHGWKGYGAQAWGLTAVDGPEHYLPYEPTPRLDDGTLAPTGAISAYVYTPEPSLAALKHFYRDLGAQVWSIYGFRDAFNLQENWYSGITMGLNQAPMAVMIENRRTRFVWRNFMANPEIRPMLRRIGFQPDAVSSRRTNEGAAK
jgi:hypothetical protein